MSEQRDVFQKFYDQACAGILAQGCKSGNDSGQCFYRISSSITGRVLKCAIGQMLTDEQIRKYTVEEAFNPYRFDAALIDELLPGVPLRQAKDFMGELQRVHDMADSMDFVEDFKYRAIRFAEAWGLTPIK